MTNSTDRQRRSSLPNLRERLADPRPLVAMELRPPRRDLEGVRAMSAWIDVYHSVRALSAADTVVFLTDNAVGTGEEENLGHLVRNLGADAVRDRIVPILTLKHPLEYCLSYAARASQEGFPGLVVLGGDPQDNHPRCLPRAWMLRERLRREFPALLLGGWANPHHDPIAQAALLDEHRDGMDFALTQVVSHHDLAPMETFLRETTRRGIDTPLFAGVFYYRSGHPRTLQQLGAFMPVPAEALARDFGERSLSPVDVASESLRRLHGAGLSRFYLSNVETGLAVPRLASIAAGAGLGSPIVRRAGRTVP